ncbi:GlxA family transcriptional regulator [Thalassovita mediterranea]|jgi:transcriptional regulator GlxA family with amidase domain|uniref:Carnitine catabolism transcriptional activator n=1 Tax=Thalassovita mediterranea TaxID=340021 RepID=A0A0P1GMA9_9RHOB|nr:GlxA family transcriptional regulator [Thalassovita mediterranea]MCG7572034.1 GlxA family transcriptional regulator [Phaeobacter sp. CNT1-3]CUH83293.1 Carnitine catabolism transcriptional activator [Thalassovita mediterranea]SIS33871.1 transcriptional regulator, AraC family with amidase-like domain [Thalassovita mediterranea]
MTRDSATHVAFLIFPEFPMACLTSAIEPLRAANEISGHDAFSWSVLSEDGAPVTASANVVFQPDHALGDGDKPDYIFVLSGPDARFRAPTTGNGHLRYLARHGVQIGAVSGGVFPLAASGLMLDRTCSVHWAYRSAFEAEYPEITVSDNVIVIDRNRLTVSGAAAMFDLMLGLVEEALDSSIMTEVACWFQHPLVRTAGVSQSVPAFKTDTVTEDLPLAVSKAIEVFTQNLEDPLSIADVADQVHVSSRKLERQFKAALGQSPLHYYRMLRMNAARQQVLYTRNSLTEVAQAVGYSSSSTLTRHYREAFGLSPTEERQKISRFKMENGQPFPLREG